MQENRSVSRGEFYRRARLKYDFLTESLLAKLVDRGHVRVLREPGRSVRYTPESWADLEAYMLNKSRTYRALIEQTISLETPNENAVFCVPNKIGFYHGGI